jgi:hypothetical protein
MKNPKRALLDDPVTHCTFSLLPLANLVAGSLDSCKDNYRRTHQMISSSCSD